MHILGSLASKTKNVAKKAQGDQGHHMHFLHYRPIFGERCFQKVKMSKPLQGQDISCLLSEKGDILQ